MFSLSTDSSFMFDGPALLMTAVYQVFVIVLSILWITEGETGQATDLEQKRKRGTLNFGKKSHPSSKTLNTWSTGARILMRYT